MDSETEKAPASVICRASSLRLNSSEALARSTLRDTDGVLVSHIQVCSATRSQRPAASTICLESMQHPGLWGIISMAPLRREELPDNQ